MKVENELITTPIIILPLILMPNIPLVVGQNPNLTDDLYKAVSSYYDLRGCKILQVYSDTFSMCALHNLGIVNVSITISGKDSYSTYFTVNKNSDNSFTLSGKNWAKNVTQGEKAKEDPRVQYSFYVCGQCFGFRGSGSGSTNDCAGAYSWSSASSVSGNTFSISWTGPYIAGFSLIGCLPIFVFIGGTYDVSDNSGFDNFQYITKWSGSKSFLYPYYSSGNPYVTVTVSWVYYTPF
jgi:hypothetical protein